VDISEALLTLALGEEKFAPLGITYRLDNAESLESIPDTQFDGVPCNMALMDMCDLPAAIRLVCIQHHSPLFRLALHGVASFVGRKRKSGSTPIFRGRLLALHKFTGTARAGWSIPPHAFNVC
jgi:hypothetical protein